MPHIRIEYSANLEDQGDLSGLCDRLLHTLLELRGADDLPVFPALGTRVLAYRADHAAVGPAGVSRDFVYVNMRITRGRDAATEQAAGEAVMAVLEQHFRTRLPQGPLGLTFHMEGPPTPAFEATLRLP